jgi:Phasin protein
MSLQQDLEAAMHSIAKLLDAANRNAAAINRTVVEIAQKNVNASFDLAKSLAEAARTPSAIVVLQTRYWRTQIGALVSQAEEARNRLFGFGAAKSRMPERGSAVEQPAKTSASRLPKAPKRTRQNSATAGLRQKSSKQTPKTARPTALTAGGELQQKGTAIEQPKTRQNPRGEPPADDKAMPRAARMEVRARPSSTRAQQSISAEISFGMLDGNAVRFTKVEAWWLVDGTWRQISPDEVLANAAVMRETRFKQLFPHVPLLPKKAFQSHRR